MLYQLQSHEYVCASCTMNYGAEASTAEDAALSVYMQHFDPTGSHIDGVRWDENTQTLHTDLREYIRVLTSPNTNAIVDVVVAPPQETIEEYKSDLNDVMQEFEPIEDSDSMVEFTEETSLFDDPLS